MSEGGSALGLASLARSSERRGVSGGASQSRVSFLLSVFHCVFKFVIYDPD